MKFRTKRRWGCVSTAILIAVSAAIFLRHALHQCELNEALIAAVAQYDTSTAISLLDLGADPNAQGRYTGVSILQPIIMRLRGQKPSGSVETPTALMTVFDNDSITVRTASGLPPGPGNLQFKAEPTGLVGALLNHGADPNVNRADGWPIIMFAVADGYSDCMRLMLDHGADINSRAKNGGTLLTYAIATRKTLSVKYLLDRGVNVNEQDGGGVTPLIEATRVNDPDIISMLKRSGAR